MATVRWAVFFFICLAGCSAPGPQAGAGGLQGVARVGDGDTLSIRGQSVRLDGIDAPEAAQTCHGQPCGQQSTRALASYIGTAPVTCYGTATDAYNRLIAQCSARGINLNAQMVTDGWAAAYRRYSTQYVPQETQARRAGRGMWQGGAPQMPWDYRAARWHSSTQVAPDPNCPIKGNVSKSGRIYHTPWSPFYDRTRIDTSAGERWFCSEAEAIAAGWRAPR